MRIHGLTVCVNYVDDLALTLPRWLEGLASLTLATTAGDACLALAAADPRIRVHITDAFTRNGATFNKGLAMNEAVSLMPWSDWILAFDADILPPADWLAQVVACNPQPGKLYGAKRWQVDRPEDADRPDLPLIRDIEYPGYFQLFHSADPRAMRPLFDETWKHAGGYDTVFQNRWGVGGDSPHKVRLPLRLLHLGPTGNWWGRGNREAMQAMMRERRKRGDYSFERTDAQVKNVENF